MSRLERAIVETVAYFDVFDYPLTLIEVWKWLYNNNFEFQNSNFEINSKFKIQNSKLSDIINVLDNGSLNNIIETKNGFYFLTGRQEIIRTRLERYRFAEPKYKIALQAIRCLCYLAFVEMIAVCNNLGYNNTPLKGDVDIFVVTKKGRLWWTRLLVTLVVSLLGIRRHGQKITNRVCLSFYLADNYLDLSEIILKPQDPYFVYWLATLAPVYDRRGIYQKFLETNEWFRNSLPNFHSVHLIKRRKVDDNRLVKFSKNFDEKLLSGNIGDFLEKLARFVQLKKMKRNTTSVANQPDTRVVVNDSILKFHETDQRQHYQKLWQARCAKVLS